MDLLPETRSSVGEESLATGRVSSVKSQVIMFRNALRPCPCATAHTRARHAQLILPSTSARSKLHTNDSTVTAVLYPHRTGSYYCIQFAIAQEFVRTLFATATATIPLLPSH